MPNRSRSLVVSAKKECADAQGDYAFAVTRLDTLEKRKKWLVLEKRKVHRQLKAEKPIAGQHLRAENLLMQYHRDCINREKIEELEQLGKDLEREVSLARELMHRAMEKLGNSSKKLRNLMEKT